MKLNYNWRGNVVKAVYMKKPGEVSLIEIDKPIAKEGEVLIKIHRVGLCGTDLQSYRGIAALTKFPLIPGHELSGEIISCGAAVPSGLFCTGDRVTVKPYFNCGHCYPCKIGRINCCENSQTLGVQLQKGALCEYIAVPYQNIIKCNALDYDEIALIEPLSVGMHLVSRVNVKEGEYVLVFGCGVIGAGAISAAYFKKAKVILADIAEEKFETARQMGAVACIDPQTENLRDRIEEITGGEGVSVVLECIGVASTMEESINIVNYAGRVGYVGYSKKNLHADATMIVKKELTIVGSRNALSDEFNSVKKNMEKHELDYKRLISATYKPEQANSAFHTWDLQSSDYIKIQIDFE